MFRILHISDLHFAADTARDQHRSILQWVTKVLGEEVFKTEIDARGHDQATLEALKNVVRRIKPDLIVVTGDVTNFGDPDSFALAAKELKDLRELARAEALVCIPGNHDCLVERFEHLRRKWWGKLVLGIATRLFSEAEIPSSIGFRLFAPLRKGDALPFLKAYSDMFPTPGPRDPLFFDAGFGTLALFLFNSSNDPTVMGNEGRIGPQQFNALNGYLQEPENEKKISAAISMALLHHHPISAPSANASAVERAVNWMADGPAFLEYMNRCGFRFILHGHEHLPFQCTVNYGNTPGPGVQIIAAGSALKGGKDHKPSFNVLDLLTPFEARLHRYDYSQTGYPSQPQERVHLSIGSVDTFHLPHTQDRVTAEDAVVRKLLSFREEFVDENHDYDLLQYEVVISADELYTGEYRRSGRVAGEAADSGLLFIITGSPKMKLANMALKAADEADSGAALRYDVVRDEPNQKVIRVLHRLELAAGASFDISLRFQWQASPEEPNRFDCVNLMYFRHPVGTLKYHVLTAVQPKQPAVRAFGVAEVRPELLNERAQAAQGGEYEYTFEIARPRPLVYLIDLEP